MRTILIVNPIAGRGRAGRILGRVQMCLAHCGVDYSLLQTEAPGQAIDLARLAATDGYERVVAMGGDGTANEVTNGLMQAAEKGYQSILGVIPAGSGNDFAYAVGISADPAAACRQLAEGRMRIVDLGRVTVDGESRFYNYGVGIGYDADALLETRKIKRLRGVLLYLWAVFRVLATNRWPYPMRITVDGTPLRHRAVTLITVANGPRAGGGFLLAPDARPDDGLFDVVVADQLGRLGILGLLPHTMNGTHKGKKPVTILQGRHVLIQSQRGVPGHMDGEILCTQGYHLEFEILPGRLKVWC